MRCRHTLNRLCRALAGLAGLLALPAMAANCGVSTAGLAFGAYDPFAGLALDSAGSITVSCDAAVPYTVALSSGGGRFLNRQMSGAGTVLYYNLYVDVSRLSVWGDGSSSTSLVSGTGPTGQSTVYGRVPAGQNVPVGLYSDNVTITVTY